MKLDDYYSAYGLGIENHLNGLGFSLINTEWSGNFGGYTYTVSNVSGKTFSFPVYRSNRGSVRLYLSEIKEVR